MSNQDGDTDKDFHGSFYESKLLFSDSFNYELSDTALDKWKLRVDGDGGGGGGGDNGGGDGGDDGGDGGGDGGDSGEDDGDGGDDDDAGMNYDKIGESDGYSNKDDNDKADYGKRNISNNNNTNNNTNYNTNNYSVRRHINNNNNDNSNINNDNSNINKDNSSNKNNKRGGKGNTLNNGKTETPNSGRSVGAKRKGGRGMRSGGRSVKSGRNKSEKSQKVFRETSIEQHESSQRSKDSKTSTEMVGVGELLNGEDEDLLRGMDKDVSPSDGSEGGVRGRGKDSVKDSHDTPRDRDGDMTPRDADDNERTSNDVTVLHPDHPHMERFQKALEALLQKKCEALEKEAKRVEGLLRKGEEERDETGVRLYHASQKVERLQKTIEKTDRRLKGVVEEKEAVEVEEVKRQTQTVEKALEVERNTLKQLQVWLLWWLL